MHAPDYRGARGAATGDDFHELWALRHALRLLDPASGLAGVTVEGLRTEDEAGRPAETWEGVDCGLYYADGDIDIEQLKYSGSAPTNQWTAARLSKSTRQRGNNSVVRRLANAFQGLFARRNGDAQGLSVRLVSNQPVDPDLTELLHRIAAEGESAAREGSLASGDRRFIKATGLKGDVLRAFAGSFDPFSRTGSRFQIEESVLRTISTWAEDDLRGILNDLLRFIRQKMLPEAKGEGITREALLLRFDFSSPRALFPCPTLIKRLTLGVPRAVCSDLLDDMRTGMQFLCLHGEAGCGKTTVLQELEDSLPAGSMMIVFDCYGAGTYLNADALRHRPQDAFLQLSNDLAAKTQLPLLLNSALDYPRSFSQRLERAAEAVASQGADALLVFAIDAADNSILAAQNRVPREASFVHDFLRLGAVPDNVRFLVTARSGRLDQLPLPDKFKKVEMQGFTLDETRAHACTVLEHVPDAWLDDFHHFTRGNPRVQSYALAYGTGDATRTLAYLRPTGKELGQIFEGFLERAFEETPELTTRFCTALVALPRPIPFEDLAGVSDMTVHAVRDACLCLGSGIRVAESGVGFADEDFEHFVRERVEKGLTSVRARVADWLAQRRADNAYAATHVAAALYNAGRGREVIQLVEAEQEPRAIRDPLLRREAQLERLRVAMRVATEHEDIVDEVRTVLIGAEAMKTDDAIRKLVIGNPDLAAAFMRDSTERLLLRDPQSIEHHGPLLFHLASEAARAGSEIMAREDLRLARAWLRRRGEEMARKLAEHPGYQPDAWKIKDDDIAAQIEAVLLTQGTRVAVEALKSWRPREVAVRVARILVPRLIQAGKAEIVEQCLDERLVRDPWTLFLLVPLALSGRNADLARIESALAKSVRHHLIRPGAAHDSWRDEGVSASWPDIVLTACEIVLARSGKWDSVLRVLGVFGNSELRRADRLSELEAPLLDLLLRAQALLARKEGRAMTVDSFLVDVHQVEPAKGGQSGRPWMEGRQHRDEIADLVGPIIPLYEARAKVLTGIKTQTAARRTLAEGTRLFRGQDYRFARRHGSFELRRRAGIAVAKLICVPAMGATASTDAALNVFGDRIYALDEIAILSILTLNGALHTRALEIVAVRAADAKTWKTVAEEKTDVMLRLARLIMPISRDDAKALFDQAHAIAGEIDVDAVHQLSALAAIGVRGAPGLATVQRRRTASDLMSVATDAAIRLSGQEGFPWESIAHALATLDLPVALASVARWEDSGVVGRQSCLPALLETALETGSMTPEAATALSPLLDSADPSLFEAIARRLAGKSPDQTRLVLEELAKNELLRFGCGARAEPVRVLTAVGLEDKESGPWLRHLKDATEFLERSRAKEGSNGGEHAWSKTISHPTEISALLPDSRYNSAADVTGALETAKKQARVGNAYVSEESVLEQIRSKVSLSDRVAHLDALTEIRSRGISQIAVATAIVAALRAWKSPGVEAWRQGHLAEVIVGSLPGFLGYLPYDSDAPISAALESIPDREVPQLLITAISRHADRLSVPAVYELVRLIVRHMSPEHASKLLTRYIQRLVNRIPPSDLELVGIGDVPEDATTALARFLYAMLSDCDARVRWRTAHAVRGLARLGVTETLHALFALYDRVTETTFRVPNGPFYWLDARLWLMIASARIAVEAPLALAEHGPRLFDIATDATLPHLLIRAFAKDAVTELVRDRLLALTPRQRGALARVNTSAFPKKKVKDPWRHESHWPGQIQGLRFYFDSIDTLPCWYEPAVRVFANVTLKEFARLADAWIVDRWQGPKGVCPWDKEARRQRYPERSWALWSHSQGGTPTVERYSTYLEWHAMWCVVGDLLRSRALASRERRGSDPFKGWLDLERLTYPPWWLADLRGPKPLETRFWSAPEANIDAWINEAREDDFLREIGIGGGSNQRIAVNAWYKTRSSAFVSDLWLRTALVQPETASALTRALQTVGEPSDYRIPDERDDHEFDTPPYRLLGWLRTRVSESRLDGKDPVRRGISGFHCTPGSRFTEPLDLAVVSDGTVKWVDKMQGEAYALEEWSDLTDDEEQRVTEAIGSKGSRLWVSTQELRRVLNISGLDMIMKVELTRKKGDRGYQRHDQEEAEEARYDRVYVLRKDGAIEAAEGRIGTWSTSGSRTGA